MATLQGHEGPVWQISWAHPKYGVLLASCSFDGSVWIHRESRPGEWTVVHAATQLHDSSVNGIAFGPEEYGQLICAAASSDGRVSILEHNPTNQTWTVDYITDCPMGVNAVSWAPRNAYYSLLEQQPQEQPPQEQQQQQQSSSPGCVLALVTAGCDNQIRFWQRTDTMTTTTSADTTTTTTTGEWTQENVPQCAKDGLMHRDWVRDVAWAPSPLIPNRNRVASCSEDGQVLIWTQSMTTTTKALGDDDVDNSAFAAAAPQEKKGGGGEWKATLVHQFDEPVWRVSWSTTGLILAVSSGESTVTLWKEGLVDNTWNRMEQQHHHQQ